MSTNAVLLDRAIRIILGIALIALAVTGHWAPWGWIGVIPLLTGITGFCGLYQLIGIKTCPAQTTAKRS